MSVPLSCSDCGTQFPVGLPLWCVPNGTGAVRCSACHEAREDDLSTLERVLHGSLDLGPDFYRALIRRVLALEGAR